MKKFAYLILSALLFAGCNNMLTNPDAFNSEDATVSMDISQLKARLATDEVVLTSTLDFVGDEPKHAPFEKTQTINGNKIEYTVKGLPTGSTVQFKLSVFKNGNLVFEGLSNKVAIKGKNNLTIGLDKISNWVLLRNTGNNFARFDLNFTDLTSEKFAENMVRFPGNGKIYAYCVDPTDNFYYVTYDGSYYCIYRLASPYDGESVPLVQLESGLYTEQIYYDCADDSLYFTETSYSYGERNFYRIPNASTTTEIELSNDNKIVAAWGSNNIGHTQKPITGLFTTCIYNGEFYWIERDDFSSTICKMPLTSKNFDTDKSFLLLYEGNVDENTTSGAIGNQISSSLVKITEQKGSSTEETKKFNPVISDLAVTNDGVFALLFDSTTYDANANNFKSLLKDNYNSARGGVIKINHDLTKAELKGWTETKNKITVDTKDPQQDSYSLTMYRPKSDKLGFYGPVKIVAIRPKKLIFLDRNEWSYVDDDKNLKGDWAQRYIILDLESFSFTEVKTLEKGIFAGSGFPVNHVREASSEYATITGTWE